LLTYGCWEKEQRGYTFTAAIDPYGDVTDKYIQSYIPLNMVMDDDMVIRYKVEDYDSAGLHGIVQQLLAE